MGTELDRRRLISIGLAGGVAAFTGEASAREVSGEFPWAPGEANRPEPARGTGYQFLSRAEAAFLDAAVARLIPSDELGPGAREAGAVFFIDRQLAGAYGAAQSWYMQGPWAEGEATQGYQSRMAPAELYRAAMRAVDEHCAKTFGDRAFTALKPEEQDQVLAGLEKGEVKLEGVSAKAFFTLLLQNTIEGFFSDPIYGGNRDMVGWKLIGFPGAHYDYRPYVPLHNQRLAVAPVGIMGRPGWDPSAPKEQPRGQETSRR